MSASSASSVVVHRIDSRVLRGNPLGDPSQRDLWVYLPPGYDPSRNYPVLLAITGFGGTGAMYFNTDPLGEDLRHRLDRLIGAGTCPPVIVVAPDCMNRVGGSQYINSPAIGDYEDYLVTEIIPFVRERHACGRWGVFGKSSGGYGAVVLAMRHPEIFAAFADHSGDANFELCYFPDFDDALDELRSAGGPKEWLARFHADENKKRRRHMRPLNILAMAAHYSPNPASPHLGIDFPFDLETGVFRPEVWERWRAWDPVNMVAAHADALRGLRAVYIDCGRQDEFNLVWGARALVARLRAIGVEPRYEEFDDGHMNITYRYDRSVPFLAAALSDGT